MPTYKVNVCSCGDNPRCLYVSMLTVGDMRDLLNGGFILYSRRVAATASHGT
ncbi:hypothetical protein ACFDR9_004196 [Janthinobacterium sp. CG_23.3]|nr:hypothetical protein [Janthinobacterium sp. CG_S6]